MIIFKLIAKNFLVVCIAFSTAQASQLVGRVIGITDGDTITVLDSEKREHKIRLMGIDAPEKKQSYGNESKKALSNYIFQKEVIVEYKKEDRYKRKVGKVILDKQDICLQMVKDGMAWHYKDYEKEQSKTDRELYSEAEDKAQKEKIGLWQSTHNVKPSEFRNAKH
jgi:endonuclease YncB( thermonuclease family)